MPDALTTTAPCSDGALFAAIFDLSRTRQLYRRLVTTTHALHGCEHLERIVRDAGLRIVETREMGFGLVVGTVGVRV